MKASAFPQIIDYLQRGAWAIHRPVLERMTAVLDRYLRGEAPTEMEREAVAAQQSKGAPLDVDYRVEGSTAIIPVSGVIAKHSRLVNGESQPRGTSIETLERWLEQAMGDSNVDTIFLQIESPGGEMSGLPDFAEEVYLAGQTKAVIAFADELSASAAYWIGSQAQRFYANQSALVGAIGVYDVLMDSSEAAKMEGLKFHMIASGPNKGVGYPGVPITDKQLQPIQDVIDDDYELFLAAILRGRGALGPDAKTLRELADGRIYTARQALAGKLIDGVMTYSQALRSARPNPRGPGRAIASASAQAPDEPKDNRDERTEPMTDAKETTATAPAAGQDVDKIRTEAAAEARQAERERIAAITGALDLECLAEARTKAIEEGLDVIPAKALAFDALKVHNAEALSAKQTELDEAQKRLQAVAAGGARVHGPDASDDGEDAGEGGKPSADDGKPETYARAVATFKAAGKKEAEAFRQAAAEFPDSHRAWIDAQPPGPARDQRR